MARLCKYLSVSTVLLIFFVDLVSKIKWINANFKNWYHNVQEIKSVFKRISESATKLIELKKTMETQKHQLAGLQETASQMQSQINEGHLHRQGVILNFWLMHVYIFLILSNV